MLLAIAWLLLNKAPKYSELLSGIVVGVTAALRPPFILLFIPFLIFRRYLFLLGGLIGLLSSLIFSATVINLFIWKRYILAMFGMTGFIDLEKVVPLSERTIVPSDIVYPQFIEGISATNRNPLEYRNLVRSSVYDILYALEIPKRQEILVIGFAIVITFLVIYLIKYSSKKLDLNFLFLFGTLMCLIGEFFIPVGRYPYYDIQFMLPLLIIVSRTKPIELVTNKLIIFLIIGLLLSLGCFLWLKEYLLFSSAAIACYVTLISLTLLKQDSRTSEEDCWRLP